MGLLWNVLSLNIKKHHPFTCFPSPKQKKVVSILSSCNILSCIILLFHSVSVLFPFFCPPPFLCWELWFLTYSSLRTVGPLAYWNWELCVFPITSFLSRRVCDTTVKGRKIKLYLTGFWGTFFATCFSLETSGVKPDDEKQPQIKWASPDKLWKV